MESNLPQCHQSVKTQPLPWVSQLQIHYAQCERSCVLNTCVRPWGVPFSVASWTIATQSGAHEAASPVGPEIPTSTQILPLPLTYSIQIFVYYTVKVVSSLCVPESPNQSLFLRNLLKGLEGTSWNMTRKSSAWLVLQRDDVGKTGGPHKATMDHGLPLLLWVWATRPSRTFSLKTGLRRR